jgi:hypothetical protein
MAERTGKIVSIASNRGSDRESTVTIAIDTGLKSGEVTYIDMTTGVAYRVVERLIQATNRADDANWRRELEGAQGRG